MKSGSISQRSEIKVSTSLSIQFFLPSSPSSSSFGMMYFLGLPTFFLGFGDGPRTSRNPLSSCHHNIEALVRMLYFPFSIVYFEILLDFKVCGDHIVESHRHCQKFLMTRVQVRIWILTLPSEASKSAPEMAEHSASTSPWTVAVMSGSSTVIFSAGSSSFCGMHVSIHEALLHYISKHVVQGRTAT